ncbi:MAG: hypothetical protein GX974_02630 [Clostridiales bacterium]|nr:hypothetical protein [Clostridiales bacterium]
MRRIRPKIYVLGAILFMLAVLYILFTYIEIFDTKIHFTLDTAKYISIVLCLLISLFIGEDHITKKGRCSLQFALFFTTVADFFLLIYPKHVLGIGIFCIAHIFHAIRFEGRKAHVIIGRHTMSLFILIVMHFIVGLYIIDIEFIYIISLFYAMLLISNVKRAVGIYKTKVLPLANSYMVAIGMVLFLLCDINVALYNTIGSNRIPFLLIWFFYLPSQVVLALSGWDYNKLLAKGGSL